MIFLLYNLLWWIASPLIPLWLFYRTRRGKEEKKRVLERYGWPTYRHNKDKYCIWIHCASVGETLSAIPLIDTIKHEFRDGEILITTATITAARILANKIEHNVIHQYIPLDHPWYMRRLFDYWQPKALLLIESELWPNVLFLCKKRNIPVFFIEGKLSTKSYRRWLKIKTAASKLFSTITKCYVSTEIQVERLRNLGVKDIKKGAPLKFARAPLAVDYRLAQKISAALHGRPIWVAASTHPGEEKIIISAHKAIRTVIPNLLTIIAPRHPNRAGLIKKMIQTEKYSCGLYSDNDNISRNIDFYIVDTIGNLGTFYYLARTAFIGGSMIKGYGGHNIIEPAQLECVPIYGPYHNNFIETVRIFKEGKVGFMVNNQEELILKTINIIQNSAAYEKQCKEIEKLLVKNKYDTTSHIIKELDAYLFH